MTRTTGACRWCSQPIEPGRYGPPRRWCSQSCRQAFRRSDPTEREKIAKRVWWKSRLRSLDRREALRCAGCGGLLPFYHSKYCSPSCTPHPPGIERTATCRTCSQPFTTRRSRQVYCSELCADRWGFRSRKHAFVPKHRRQKILKRDGWICYLCTRPIPRDAVYPHPLSGTVDHVIPVSAGGSNREDNLRAAHWGCNWEKGDQLPAIEVWVPGGLTA